MFKLRVCQEQAILIGSSSKQTNNVIKMFCGSGKTNVMVFTFLLGKYSYGVFVFPSIALISQFNRDYVKNFEEYAKLNICSRNEGYDSQFTTEPDVIKTFLERSGKKMVCVTYQSLQTLIESSDIKPGVVFYDEAHHIFEPRVKDIVFSDYASKQYMFTATPKMDENISLGDPIYSYSHADGVRDGHLNDFQIYVDTSCDSEVYPKIARTILTTGNSRVLTFHSDVVNSVSGFVNQTEFSNVFHQVCQKEFPHLVGRYKSIKMFGIDASTTNRPTILGEFDSTPDDEIYILASCRTIGEGVDTKKANMCVFVDTKNSYVDIVQNIGRVVRKQPNISTVLLPVSVNKDKYEITQTSVERDAAIREDLSNGGDFRMILNVLSALRADDPELFDMCIKYPNKFSSDEMKKNFDDQGAELTDEVFEDSFEDHPDVTFEVHTQDMENPIEEYNTDKETTETVTLFRDEDDTLLVLNTNRKISPPKRKPLIKFHTSEDFKVLWELSSFGDTLCARLESKMSGQEYERIQLEKAQKIIDFHKTHERTPNSNSKDPEEKKLGIKFSNFKTQKKANKLYASVDELFTNYFGDNWWDRDLEQIELEKAQSVIDFHTAQGRTPAQTAKDPDEKKLGQKFGTFKTVKKANKLYARVDELFTNYFGDNWWDREEIELEKAQSVIDFHMVHDRTPNTSSKDPDEKKLGHKFSKFKTLKKANKLYVSVDELFTNYFGDNWWDREQIELEKAQKIIDFHNTHERTPGEKSLDQTEKKLGHKFSNFKTVKKANKLYASVDKLFTKAFGANWWNQKKCAHKWAVIDEDEHFHFMKCEKCGRKSRKNRNSSDGRYHEPNPVKKKDINKWFGGIDYIPGKAVILDAENMNTTNGLYISKSFTPEQIVIPEYDTETYEKNSRDPTFGKCVKNGDFLEILKGENPSDLSLIYADFTGTFHKWIEPLFSYLETSSIKSGVILGITWSVNGHKADVYTNMVKIGAFCGKSNWEEIEKSPSECGYGAGGNMFVKFLRKL